jgi:membrane-associated protease RseP (regulator of RpoE activity)
MLNVWRAAMLATLASGPLAAQECRFPDLGLQGFACRNCHIRVDKRNGVRDFRFGTELTLGRIRAHGPTAGVLREGDVLVAVDGAPITTAEGGRRFGALAPGRAATFTIRRDGRTSDVRVVPGAQCQDALLGAPPRPPRPPEPPRPAMAPHARGGAVPVPPHPPLAPAPPPARAHGAVPAAPAPPPPPPPPPAVAPPLPPVPPAPPEIRPDGWFGFSIGCTRCEFRDDNGVLSIRGSLPEVGSVEPGTPAARAGLRRGDRLTHVEGVSLRSPEAWRRLRSARPGQSVRWTYERNGRAQTVAIRAAARPDPRPAPSPARAAGGQRLRYSGTVGGAEVEVRGAPVSVTRDPRTGETIIRSSDLTVRVRP